MRKKLMKLYIQFILVSIGMGFSNSNACNFLDEQSWTWSDKDLVKNAQRIFLVRMISREKYGNSYTYYFSVIDSIRGSAIKQRVYISNIALEDEKNGKKHATFLTSDCRIGATFKKNGTYLLLMNAASEPNILHPKAYEEVDGVRDAWVSKVKALASLPENEPSFPKRK